MSAIMVTAMSFDIAVKSLVAMASGCISLCRVMICRWSFAWMSYLVQRKNTGLAVAQQYVYHNIPPETR